MGTDAGDDQRAAILVVDDEPAQLALIDAALNGTVTVHGARNGGDALRLAREHRPQLALVDISVGTESGWDIGRALRELGVPTLYALSGHAAPEPAEPGAHADLFDRWIRKPYSIHLLREAVREALQA